MGWTAAEAREKIGEEHARVRMLLAEAERLSDGRTPRAFVEAIVSLRRFLALHNFNEEALLLPLLENGGPRSSKLAQRMIEEHKAEHIALRNLLSSNDPDELAGALPDLATKLRHHLAEEERTFLDTRLLGAKAEVG